MPHKKDAYLVYEKIANWFDKHRSYDLQMEKNYLDLVISHIPKAGKILDVGCGTGMPIARYFLDHGFAVTGIDASEKMLDKAKTYVPEAELLLKDMRSMALGAQFEAIILWHSFFHLPAEDQAMMFSLIETHIKPHGIILFTSGPDAGEAWGENGGENLYHASLSTAHYQDLLKQHHFEVLIHKIEDPECGGATVWAARHTGN